MISSPHLLSDIGFELFVHHVTSSYAKPMQSEPERELISSPFESFESFVLLSRDVTALRNVLICKLPYKRCIVIIIFIIIIIIIYS